MPAQSGNYTLGLGDSGKINDLTGQAVSANRTVRFDLQNCAGNLAVVAGSSIAIPTTKSYTPNAAGMLAGTIVGNDVVSCGTTVGQTYYEVSIFVGAQKVYDKNYAISGASWNIATALPLNNDPTAFLRTSRDTNWGRPDLRRQNQLGGNKDTIIKYLANDGDGTNAVRPPRVTVPAPTTIPILKVRFSKGASFGSDSNSVSVALADAVTA